MPYLSAVGQSISATMSTGYLYHTTLTATWVSDYVYDLVFSITRESNQGANGWRVQNTHGYRLMYYGPDGNIQDTGKVSLAGTLIQTGTAGASGPAGWADRTVVIFTRRITTHPTNRRVIASYYATLNNSAYGGSANEYKEFWSPSSDINAAEILPDGPNTYIYTGGQWKRAKDIWVYTNSGWQMVRTGDLNVYTGNQWKS